MAEMHFALARAAWSIRQRRMSQKSLPIRAAILSAIVFVAAGTILPVTWLFTRNLAGVFLGGAAASICWVAALLAMATGERLRAAGHVMAFLVAGTSIRTGIPLLAALVAIFYGRPLDDAAFLYYLIGFYPITLVAEIVLALPGRVDGSGLCELGCERTCRVMDLEELANHVCDTTFFHTSFGHVHLGTLFGIHITRFMVLELIAVALMFLMFRGLARRIEAGAARGVCFGTDWNCWCLFIRDEVARPSIGKHDADRYLPLLWNLFFFVLLCNLLGALPGPVRPRLRWQ